MTRKVLQQSGLSLTLAFPTLLVAMLLLAQYCTQASNALHNSVVRGGYSYSGNGVAGNASKRVDSGDNETTFTLTEDATTHHVISHENENYYGDDAPIFLSEEELASESPDYSSGFADVRTFQKGLEQSSPEKKFLPIEASSSTGTTLQRISHMQDLTQPIDKHDKTYQTGSAETQLITEKTSLESTPQLLSFPRQAAIQTLSNAEHHQDSTQVAPQQATTLQPVAQQQASQQQASQQQASQQLAAQQQASQQLAAQQQAAQQLAAQQQAIEQQAAQLAAQQQAVQQQAAQIAAQQQAVQQQAAQQQAAQQQAAQQQAAQQQAAQQLAAQQQAAQQLAAQPTTQTTVQSAAQPTTVQPAAQPTTVQPAAQPTTVQPAAQPTAVQPAAQQQAVQQLVSPAPITPEQPAAPAKLQMSELGTGLSEIKVRNDMENTTRKTKYQKSPKKGSDSNKKKEIKQEAAKQQTSLGKVPI